MNNKIVSTRGTHRVSIDEAILSGLAKDGGLFVPEVFPEYSLKQFYENDRIADFSSHLLTPFFSESKINTDKNFCKKVFSFPLELKPLGIRSYILELFHGPTLSFKDFGARFFAQCIQQLMLKNETRVLVATSGDTGSAVASALHEKRGLEGFILFPKDKISERQQAQITCWGKNIHAIAVNGTFDQCQQLVKLAINKAKNKSHLTTANSINLARLLPQVIFYAYASTKIAALHDELANFIVPSGNLGNVTACYWAKAMGFPIDEILIANNANRVLTDYLNTGVYEPRPSVKTLANAMDVGDPGNLERLIYLFKQFSEFKKQVNVQSVDDEQIKKAIIDCYQKYNYVICPHTATAYYRLKSVDTTKPWIIMATAHPAKFNDLIEPLLNIILPVPEQLYKLLNKKQNFTVIEPSLEFLEMILYNTSYI